MSENNNYSSYEASNNSSYGGASSYHPEESLKNSPYSHQEETNSFAAPKAQSSAPSYYSDPMYDNNYSHQQQVTQQKSYESYNSAYPAYENSYEQKNQQYQQMLQYGGGNQWASNKPPHPQSTTVMVMGIIGIFNTICAIIGWILGNNALKDPNAAHYDMSTVSTWTKVSKWMTIIHVVLTSLLILFYIAMFIFIGSVPQQN